MDFIDFLISHYSYDEVFKIVMMYVDLAEFSGEAKYMFQVDSLLNTLWRTETDTTKAI